MDNTPDSPAKTPVGYTTRSGNYWTLITPEIWKVLHAVLHTYGTNAVANDVPLDVVQQTLGHTSLATTTIYTQGEKKRKAGEMGRFFKRKCLN
ncbi:MAG: tyrosine-type recombinase/integrase [Azonexus sp.]|nr:tyrosine-type recombinase/integrase [Azonexus sp.]